MDYSVLPQKWQDRFKFFDEHGGPATPEFKAALSKLDFKDKIKYGANIISFFFGWIHFFVLGMWKKNLVILGVCIVFGIIFGTLVAGLGFPIGTVKIISRAFNLVFMIGYSMIANYAYYLHVVKGSQSWNPLEGILKPIPSDKASQVDIQ